MPIPKDAKKVFEGVIFDVYQWEEQLYDGTTATFEAIKRQGTVQVIPVYDGKLLLSHEEQPNKPKVYTFLGGRMEENEDPLIATKRELLEEAGLDSDDWELYKDYTTQGKVIWPTYLFIARNCRKVAEPQLDAGEKIEVEAFDFDGFMDTVTKEDFWGVHLAYDFFRMKHDPQRLEEFRNKLGV